MAGKVAGPATIEALISRSPYAFLAWSIAKEEIICFHHLHARNLAKKVLFFLK
jgi:hypothetical protein